MTGRIPVHRSRALAVALVVLFACSPDSASRNDADTHVDYAAARELSPGTITFHLLRRRG
jgi:hypothetical protein